MSMFRTQQRPGLLGVVAAIALAIVLAVGGSAAIAGFLTDWGRDGRPDSSSSRSEGNEQTATALKAIATAEDQVRHGKVFQLQDHDDGTQRVWAARVADPDGRQFDLTISHDGSSVININEDKTTNDDVQKLRSANIPLKDAINTAVEQARGKGNLTSLGIDTTSGDIVMWQIEFGGDYGTTVLFDGTTVRVDASSGEVLTSCPDTD
jgi:uncharacterized membrane protein YkoI